MSREDMDLLASMIEEVDFTASLSDTLYQIARRVGREEFSPAGQAFIEDALTHLDRELRALSDPSDDSSVTPEQDRLAHIEDIRWRVIDAQSLRAIEKGAILALLGSMERAEGLIDRIAEERSTAPRPTIHADVRPDPSTGASVGS